MDFKYFDDYEHQASLTNKSVRCEICEEETICFDPVFSGDEEMEHICPRCLYNKRLYGRRLFTNRGDFDNLLLQIKEIYTSLPDAEQFELAAEKTSEIEQATPQLLTWQDMKWPCLDGDYAKFIGFGSKQFLNELAVNGEGKVLFKNSLHSDLQEYYAEEQWTEMLPDKAIKSIEESSFSTLFYIFKSLTSEKLIIWWDCD